MRTHRPGRLQADGWGRAGPPPGRQEINGGQQGDGNDGQHRHDRKVLADPMGGFIVISSSMNGRPAGRNTRPAGHRAQDLLKSGFCQSFDGASWSAGTGTGNVIDHVLHVLVRSS